MVSFYLILGFCAILPVIQSQKPELTTIFEWKTIEYSYGSEALREDAIKSGAFIPNVAVPFDVDAYYDADEPKIFVTIPRNSKGIPATLGTVSHTKRNGYNLITPFPSWEWHANITACKTDRIISVYRVKADECGRLWVLDSGKVECEQICPPQVLAFDPKSGELLNRYEIPKNLYGANSLFITIIAEVRNIIGCKETFIYIADLMGFAIIVYDAQNGKAWKVSDKTFRADPDYANFTTQGVTWNGMEGLLGMDLSPNVPGKDRILYYHALSSISENWVYTSILRNQSRIYNDTSSSPEIFHTYPQTRPSQSAALAIDRNGIEYFGLQEETSINCWNTRLSYGTKNIHTVYYNPLTMQFACGVKIVTNKRDHQELWTLTNRLHIFKTQAYNPDQINFRISTGKTSNIGKC